MKYFQFIVILVLCSFSEAVLVPVHALPMNIECLGATQREAGNDTLFFFKDEIHVRSLLGKVDWYSTETGMVVHSNDEHFYPEDGGYFIVQGGVEYSPFYVFRLKNADLSMTVEPSCENTLLQLT